MENRLTRYWRKNELAIRPAVSSHGGAVFDRVWLFRKLARKFRRIDLWIRYKYVIIKT